MAARSVTAADPDRASGPGRDVTISAPGRAHSSFRVLSSSNAPADLATIRVRLNSPADGPRICAFGARELP